MSDVPWYIWILPYLVIGGALGWCLWVLDPRHPERLENLRKRYGAEHPK